MGRQKGKSSLNPVKTKGEPNYYDTLKLEVIKELKKTYISLYHRLYLPKIKIDYKTTSIRNSMNTVVTDLIAT